MVVANVEVRMGHERRVILHQPTVHLLGVGRLVVPGLQLFRARRQFRVSGDHADSLLLGKGRLALFVPAVIEFTDIIPRHPAG
jgi:hypothetical protein